ncbi:hypothetical protein HRbin30_03227 [bacterium HR30]|nr:hypothetical protein HRbin30_03227 [bacterium HR30]
MARFADWLALGLVPWLGLVLARQVDALPMVVLVAAPTGFLLQQLARFHLEVVERAFDHPTRPALALIQARLGADSGCSAKAAYRIYEVTLYQYPDWIAARAHIHRCWHWIATLRAASLGVMLAGVGSFFSSAGAGEGEWFPVSWVLSLAAGLIAVALWRKAEHTKMLLHEFDCAWILAHWPAYEAVAARVLAREQTNP